MQLISNFYCYCLKHKHWKVDNLTVLPTLVVGARYWGYVTNGIFYGFWELGKKIRAGKEGLHCVCNYMELRLFAIEDLLLMESSFLLNSLSCLPIREGVSLAFCSAWLPQCSHFP